MNCPDESICIVYPAWYLIAALVFVAIILIALGAWAVWESWSRKR